MTIDMNENGGFVGKDGRPKNVGIYVHVPFCLSKCHYCDFCSVTGADEAKKAAYVSRICSEIGEYAEKIKQSGALPQADTVYFGGGTPTLMSAEQFYRILEAVELNFGISQSAEITAECNPRSVDGKGLSDLRGLGVNRLSIGMQSIHDSELRMLGRIHDSGDFLETYEAARKAGFGNVSVDLMYGIPNQTRELFKKSIEGVAMLSPEHISSYSLTVEEGTSFYRRRDRLELPDDDTVGDMYADMSEILAKYGYNKYEISNFSKEGRESRHNLKYWNCENYLGFGPAAHSYFDGVRFAHSHDIDAYIGGKNTIIEPECIEKGEAMNEYAMLGMRLSRGIDLEGFKARFDEDFLKAFDKFKQYSPDFVEISEKRCRFTDRGMFVSNAILSNVLDFGE